MAAAAAGDGLMQLCSAPVPNAGFVSSVTSYVDCQAQILGSGGWQALAMPGSSLSIVLTGFLTIFIALIGYNLLLGHTFTVRSGTLAFVKIGAVFALATSWPAYRTLVYDIVSDGPAQLVAELGPQAGIVGSDGSLVQRLDLVDHAMAQLAILGAGDVLRMSDTLVPPPFAGFDNFALGGSRILFLFMAVAGLTGVRFVAGLLLALGPFFIAFLMFDNTRSLFEGWVRVLAGAALAAAGVSIALGLELAFVEPWLSAVLARRMAGEALPTVPAELFVITALFAVILLAAIYACTRVARGFRLAPLLHGLPTISERPSVPAERGQSAVLVANRRESERGRAEAVARVLSTANKRERGDAATPGYLQRTARSEVRLRTSERERQPNRLGHTFSRRPGSRVSAQAARRDRQS